MVRLSTTCIAQFGRTLSKRERERERKTLSRAPEERWPENRRTVHRNALLEPGTCSKSTRSRPCVCKWLHCRELWVINLQLAGHRRTIIGTITGTPWTGGELVVHRTYRANLYRAIRSAVGSSNLGARDTGRY